MRLVPNLQAKFVRYEKRNETTFEGGVVVQRPRIFLPFVEGIDEAQGVEFLCPKCYANNNGPIGTHAVICWSRSRGVPDDAEPGPGRWRLVGTGLHDLSLMEEPGKSRSVALKGGCAWHGFVTNGEAA